MYCMKVGDTYSISSYFPEGTRWEYVSTPNENILIEIDRDVEKVKDNAFYFVEKRTFKAINAGDTKITMNLVDNYSNKALSYNTYKFTVAEDKENEYEVKVGDTLILSGIKFTVQETKNGFKLLKREDRQVNENK